MSLLPRHEPLVPPGARQPRLHPPRRARRSDRGRRARPRVVTTVQDIRGREFATTNVPQRIVSLVPSLTEALFAFGAGPRIVGVTEYCVEPAAARALPQVGGTKTADLSAIEALRPDFVV